MSLLTAALLLAAPPGELELQWRDLAGCPDAAAVVREVEAALGRPLAPLGERPITAAGALERVPGAEPFRLLLEVRRDDAVDRREFRATSCETLAGAAAVVLAAAIDPSLAAQPVAPPPDPAPPAPTPGPALPPPAPPPDALAEPPARAPAPTDAPPAPRLAALLRVGAPLTIGLVPRASPGLLGGFSLVTPRLRVEVDGLWISRRLADPGGPDDLRIAVGGGAASVRVCARSEIGPLEAPICLGGQAGALRGRAVGVDIDQPASVLQPWGALLVGTGLRIPFLHGWAAVLVRADALVALARPRFGLAGLDRPVHVTPAAAFQTALALEVRIK